MASSAKRADVLRAMRPACELFVLPLHKRSADGATD